jgi:hypothetical protein
MTRAHLVVTSLGWPRMGVEAPPLAGGAGAAFTQWDVSRAEAGEAMVAACVATPIPGWVDDMRPAVDAKNATLMNVSAERVMGAPLDAQNGVSHAFVGWDEGVVVTCFAVCGAREPRPHRACDEAVRAASLEGAMGPPAPGIVLGAVTWGVHHPQSAVTWGAALVVALGVIAVISRRRPRSRI